MKKLLKSIALTMVLCMMFSTVAFAAEKEDADGTLMGVYSINAPAPKLTQFRVYAVFSENQPNGEYIQNSSTVYQTATMLDHGGSWLRVVTLEYGYAGTRTATFKNTPMTRESVQGYDDDGDRIIDYYLVTWLYEGDFTNGLFSATSKSVNSPWNTMYITNFNIR